MALTRTLLALVLGCALLVAAPAASWDADYGRVWRGDGVLKPGCQDYGFRYRVRPGNNHWGVEFFLIGPGREGLASLAMGPEAGDPKRGRAEFEVCRAATRPGRFKIRGKLTITKEGSLLEGETREVHWVKPARFRLRRS